MPTPTPDSELRALWAAYLAYICAPGADLEFEYLTYTQVRDDLLSEFYAPAGVVEAYTLTWD